MTVAERAGEDGLGEGDGVNADGVETNVAEEGRVAVDEQTQLLIDGEGLDLEGKGGKCKNIAVCCIKMSQVLCKLFAGTALRSGRGDIEKTIVF